MGNRGTGDLARQVANAVGAFFQSLAGVFFVANLSAEPVADEGAATLIDPAGFAFFIWAPILFLSLAYAAYQALPSKRGDALLRRVGWPLAGAFFFNGLWEVTAPLGRLGVAQVLIAGILAFLAIAYLRVVRGGAGRGSLNGLERWLVALPVGIYFGWITAANAVSLTSLSVRSGVVGGETIGGALLGAVLLLLGSVAAAVVVRAGRSAAPQGYVAYGATVLWALFGVVANQYQASVFTTVVAAICAALVAWALFGGAPRDLLGTPATQR